MKKPARPRPDTEVQPGPASDETLPPPDDPGAAGPVPDRFSEGRWEREAASLIQALHTKNQRILALERDAGRRDERLRTAIVRLREAEGAIDSQTRLRLLAADGKLDARAPDVLTRLASEKGALESREKQLRSDQERLRSQVDERDRALTKLKTALNQTRAALQKREQQLHGMEQHLKSSESSAARQVGEAEDQLSTLREQAALSAERARSTLAAFEKSEQALRQSEQQAALYRKNLLRAEETLKAQQNEHAAQRVEHRRALDKHGELERRIEALERERDSARRAGRRADRLAHRLLAQSWRAGAALRLSATTVATKLRCRDAELAESGRAVAARDHQLATAAAEIEQLSTEIQRLLGKLREARETSRLVEETGAATRHLAASSLLAAEERLARELEEHGVPLAALAETQALAHSPSGVGKLLRWIRRN